MEPIQFKDTVFLLNTADSSYLLRVDQYKHLEHIHFAGRVLLEDYEALSYKKKIAHGTTIMYDEKNDVYTSDSLCQEFPTYGTGDFNEAAIEIEGSSSFTCDFLYDSYEIVKGDVLIKGLPSSYGADCTLILHISDKVNHLALDLYYAVFYQDNIISRRCVLTNQSEETLTLHKLMSYSMDLCEEKLVLMDFHGAWDCEMHLNEREVQQGTCVLTSRVGFSSAKANPGFILRQAETKQDYGKAWGFNLVYSGNHYSSVSKNEYGHYRIMSGISSERFHYSLKKGDVFSSPEAIMTYSNQGLNLLSQNFHSFINKHIVRSSWKNKQRPILINSWEGFGFDFTKKDLLSLAKQGKDLGMELFVLDDGWFGRRDSDKRGLGDYDCNLTKIPGGLSSLSEEIHKMGMMFGLWVEPEAINIDSKLYEKHPEYALCEKDRAFFFGRNELLMDLTNKEVRDYIVDQVSKLIDENQIDYIKWDMNRLMNGVSGVYNHKYIKGLYEVLDRIFSSRPQVLLESCSSGGNRFDLGMLCYSPQIWSSDDTDPIERMDIQNGLSYLYPLSVMGAHVSASPHSQTLRHTPLPLRFAVSAYGCLGYELDLSKLSVVDKEEIRNQIVYYKKHRLLFQYGKFYRIEKDKRFVCFEVEDETIIVTKFRKIFNAVPSFDKLYVYNTKQENYIIESRSYISELNDYKKYIQTCEKEENANRFVSVSQHYEASGAALKEGILLDPIYLGSGYNSHIRIPLDYGCDMYLIQQFKKSS